MDHSTPSNTPAAAPARAPAARATVGTRLLTGVLILQGAILAGQWLGAPALPTANAQIPDAGGQRLQMIEELRAMNAKMDKLIGILESGKLEVRVAQADENNRPGRAR